MASSVGTDHGEHVSGFPAGHTPLVPDVTVLMAVYNGGEFLEPALRSIMEQTLRNIEILVIDDCSTDDTPEILARLAEEDPRIRIVRLEFNHRLPKALNVGLKLARAPYIARMDADDIAYPTRLEKQKEWLDANPNTILLGASVRQIDAQGRLIRISRRPRDTQAVRWLARFNMPLSHPTFMFRRDVGAEDFPRYRVEAGYAEDYDFVVRALEFGDIACLDEILLDYRVHKESISRKNWSHQQQFAHDIAFSVQTRDLPPHILDSLSSFREAYFKMQPVSASALFGGLRDMISHDQRSRPDLQPWMLRQSAQYARVALRRGGCSEVGVIWAFMVAGRDFIPGLLFRLAETKRQAWARRR